MIEETLQFAIQARSNANDAIDGVTVALKNQSSMFDRLSNKIPFVSAAISAAMMAITEATNRYVEAMKKAGEVSVVSSEQFYALDRAMKQQGNSMKDVSGIIEQMNQARTELARGMTSEFAKRLELLSGGDIDLKAQDNAEAIQKLGETFLKSGNNIKLFDEQIRESGVLNKEGAIALRDLAKAQSEGSISLRELTAEYRQLAPIMEIAAKQKLKLSETSRQIGNTVTRITGPAMNDLFRIMNYVVEGVQNMLKAWEPTLRIMLQVGTFIKAVLVVAVGDLVTVFRFLGRIIWTVVITPFKLLFTILRPMIKLFVDLIRWIGEFIDKSTLLKIALYPIHFLARVFGLITDETEKTKAAIKDAEKAAKEGLSSIRREAKRDLFGEMIGQMLNMPREAIPALMETLKRTRSFTTKTAADLAERLNTTREMAGVGFVAPGAQRPTKVQIGLKDNAKDWFEIAMQEGDVPIEKAVEP